MAKTVYWAFLCILSMCLFAKTAVCVENAELLDEIISQIRENKTMLTSYRGDYRVREIRLPNPDSSQQRPVLDIDTKGTFVVDRPTGQFKDARENGYSWNASRHQWTISPTQDAAYDDMNVSLLDKCKEGRATPSGVIRDPKENKCGVYGIERYFSRIGGMPLDEYFEHVRDIVHQVVRLDEYKFKIVVESTDDTDDELKGFREEYVVDSRYGWNMVSDHGFYPSGNIRYEKLMEYDVIDGLPFLKSASREVYLDQDGDDLTAIWMYNISVDVNSVELNPKLEKKDFSIIFPPGTRVKDARYNIKYTVEDPTMPTSEIGGMAEPAFAMLQEEYTPEKDKETTGRTEKMTEDPQVGPPDTVRTEPVLSTTKSRLWPYVVLTVAMVLIILGIARRRRTAAS